MRACVVRARAPPAQPRATRRTPGYLMSRCLRARVSAFERRSAAMAGGCQWLSRRRAEMSPRGLVLQGPAPGPAPAWVGIWGSGSRSGPPPSARVAVVDFFACPLSLAAFWPVVVPWQSRAGTRALPRLWFRDGPQASSCRLPRLPFRERVPDDPAPAPGA